MKTARAGMLRPLDSIQRKQRPWAYAKTGKTGLQVLTSGGEILEANPGTEATRTLAGLDTHVIFADNLRSILAVTDPTVWQVKQRRERHLEARHILTDARIVFLPHGFDPTFVAFATYMKWLESIGVYPTGRTGWSTLGRHLFLASLESPVRFFGPMACGRAALYGGRKHAPFPTTYRNATKWDIRGAYAASLGNYRMPRMLEPSRNPAYVLSGTDDGIGFGIVSVPPMAFRPLPQRADRRIVRLVKWPTGEINGWWPLAELRLAQQIGCKVTVHCAFTGRLYHHDFQAWLGLVEAGRNLPNGAAALAKQHANLLWSSFSSTPSRIIYKRYTAERKPIIIREIPAGPDFTHATSYIAILIAGAIRARLHKEILMPNGGEYGHVIHADTDGAITATRFRPTGIIGPHLGEWRKVRDMPTVEIKSPNAYRYTCPMCSVEHSEWHYCVAGARNEDAQKRAFQVSSRRRDDA